MSYQGLKRHGGNLNVYYKEKEANLKRLMLYDYNYMIFWKSKNYQSNKKIRDCHGCCGEG